MLVKPPETIGIPHDKIDNKRVKADIKKKKMISIIVQSGSSMIILNLYLGQFFIL